MNLLSKITLGLFGIFCMAPSFATSYFEDENGVKWRQTGNFSESSWCEGSEQPLHRYVEFTPEPIKKTIVSIKKITLSGYVGDDVEVSVTLHNPTSRLDQKPDVFPTNAPNVYTSSWEKSKASHSFLNSIEKEGFITPKFAEHLEGLSTQKVTTSPTASQCLEVRRFLIDHL